MAKSSQHPSPLKLGWIKLYFIKAELACTAQFDRRENGAVLSAGIEPALPDPQSGVLSIERQELFSLQHYNTKTLEY